MAEGVVREVMQRVYHRKVLAGEVSNPPLAVKPHRCGDGGGGGLQVEGVQPAANLLNGWIRCAGGNTRRHFDGRITGVHCA